MKHIIFLWNQDGQPLSTINTPAPKLNVALDTALNRLEEEDPQLKGCFINNTFTTRNLAANDINKIIYEVNKISHKIFYEEK